jgi:hypothetical protein
LNKISSVNIKLKGVIMMEKTKPRVGGGDCENLIRALSATG